MGHELEKWDKVQGRDSRGCKTIEMASNVCWANLGVRDSRYHPKRFVRV